MEIEKQTMKRISDTARIKLSEKEEETLTKDLNNILSFFSEIKKLDLKEEEEYYIGRKKSKLRKDKAKNRGDESSEIIKAFNSKEEDYLIAPKTL
jgi:aspartyl/glutamyl-tRNA(Asn/Gln) amidotransferase C subunit